MAASVATSVMRSSRGGAGFGTKTPQHQLPINASVAAVPGPGAYEVLQRSKSAESRRPSSAFKSGSKRLKDEEMALGDPGAYDPYTTHDLAAKARSSHGRSARSGAGGFGSMSARELKVQSAGSDTPGPGTYTQGGGLVDKNPNKPSSAFRSTSSQRMKGHTEDVPGIGSYDPNMGSVEPNNAGSISSMRSTAERFKGESVTTEPAVGPGAHESAYDSKGNRATVGAVVEGNQQRRMQYGAARVESAAFRSDTVRDLPY